MASIKLKMAMVGGGQDSFIGDVHRKAAMLDGGIELVAGAFSSSVTKSRRAGRALGLDSKRVYASHEELLAGESALAENERADFVSIVTPNHLHFPIAKAALKAGFHVVCDKPMTVDLAQAKALRAIVRKSGRVFCLTHNYSGYPMVKLARDIARGGSLGTIQRVDLRYLQGWLNSERGRKRLATWRMDPKRAGAAGALGDIGTHAEHLGRYVTGLEIRQVSADLAVFTPQQRLDDDGSVLLRFRAGARGVLQFSRVATGRRNGLALSVYGDRGALHWDQEAPNQLRTVDRDATETIHNRGAAGVMAHSPGAANVARLPHGHPEGFLEAFANIYRAAAEAMRGDRAPEDADFPTADDGVASMKFVEAVLANSRGREKWTTIR